MPLELLMAKYGYTANPEAAAPSGGPRLTPKPSKHSPASQHSDASPASPQPPLDPKAAAAKAVPAEAEDGQPAAAATEQSGRDPVDSEAVAQESAGAVQPAQHAQQAQQAQHAQQAQQAMASGMDAFEHSQALAERRASGAQAGPSHSHEPASGQYKVLLTQHAAVRSQFLFAARCSKAFA